jgi:hypothetical protein
MSYFFLKRDNGLLKRLPIDSAQEVVRAVTLHFLEQHVCFRRFVCSGNTPGTLKDIL